MIFESIYDMDNLQYAWSRVRASKSPPGIDRVTCDHFEKNLSVNLHNLQRQIREESYKPMPVTVFNKSKKKGFRNIGISTVRDKVVQQAALKAIRPHFENHLLPCCLAYRPGKSALAAVAKAVEQINKGHLWALQMDVANFFDTMDHGILLGIIGVAIKEKPVIRLLSRLLKARIFKEMGLFDNVEGTQQGSGLSPLLSNIYMMPIDRFLWKRYGRNYLRFSDDILILSREQEPLEEAKPLIEQCLKEIKLAINPDKTSIAHVSKGIVYMGYCIDVNGKGPSRKSVHQFRQRLEKYNKVRKTDDVAERLREITSVIRGWHNYYKTLKPPNILSLLAQVELAGEFGETNLVRTLLKQSGDFTHNHPDICLRLGEQFLSQGMEPQAMREYAKALEMDPGLEIAKEKVRELQEGEREVHKAIDKVKLVLHHNPTYRDGFQKLAEYYVGLGLYGFAEKAHEKALEIDAEGQAPPPLPPAEAGPEEKGFDYRHVDQAVFLDLFNGRKDAHSKQWVDEQGRWGFMRVDRPMRNQDVYKHLKGEITLGAYPVAQNDTVRYIVFDIDTAKRKILEADPLELDGFREKAHQDVLRLKTVCEQMGVTLYVEDSGYKGRHGWLFFDQPFPASQALKLGQRIMQKAGGASEGMIWELFPMGKSDRHKSVIKLPLGINRKNKRRCLFLTDAGEPIKDQPLLLKNIRKNKVETVAAMTVAPEEDAQPSGPADAAPESLKKMVQNCRIVRHLVSKAMDTNYLTYYERMCLLYTLTFAGQEGVDYLHKVIGYCLNYNKDYTQRQIDRRKESPMSCPKIAEYFPELVQMAGCSCKFKLPAHGYPSPAMYLLESEIKQAYSIQEEDMNQHDAEKEEGPDAEPGEAPILDFEQLFSFESTPPKTETGRHEGEELDTPRTEEKADPAQTPDLDNDAGASNASKTEPLFDEQPPDSPPPGRADAQQGLSTRHEPWKLINDLMERIQQREELDKNIQAISKRLESLFDDQNTNKLQTPFGTVERFLDENGASRWRIETISCFL